MTLSPAAASALSGHSFRAEDIEACISFFDLSRDETIARLREGHHRLIRLWRQQNPQTDAERQAWYATSDAHIFEGLAWHAQPTQQAFREQIAARCSGRVLDWGCGVGTEGILAAQAGCEVVLIEMGLMARFVRHRAAYAKGIQVIDLAETFIDVFGRIMSIAEYHRRYYKSFDAIICLDVLEHLEDPERLLAKFGKWLKPDGLFIGSAPFSELQWPGHLSKHRGKLLSRLCEKAGITNYWIDPIRPGLTCGVDT